MKPTYPKFCTTFWARPFASQWKWTWISNWADGSQIFKRETAGLFRPRTDRLSSLRRVLRSVLLIASIAEADASWQSVHARVRAVLLPFSPGRNLVPGQRSTCCRPTTRFIFWRAWEEASAFYLPDQNSSIPPNLVAWEATHCIAYPHVLSKVCKYIHFLK